MSVLQMVNNNRRTSLAIILVLVGTYTAGYYTGKEDTIVPEIITRVVKGEERVVYKDRIVTVTKVVRPDGTVEETTRTEDRSGSTERTDTDTRVTASKPDYAVGVSYHVSPDKLVNPYWENIGVTGGRRLLGNIWLTGEVQPLEKEVSLGLSYQF